MLPCTHRGTVGLAVVLLITAGVALSEKTKLDEDGIYDFREDKIFDDVIEGKRIVSVFFHDPHLAASESVKYEYRLACKELKEEGVDMQYGIVDTSNANTRGLLRRFSIFRVPTVLIFHESIPYQFYGNLTRTGLVEVMREHAQPNWKSDHADGIVTELSDDTIQDFTLSRRAVMMMFYAPWCNHCKQMEPAYMDAAEMMQEHKPAVPFGRVDGAKYSDISTRFNVTGFPTLIFYRNGQEIRYDGARSAHEIAQWIKVRIAPASTPLKPLAGAAKKHGTISKDAVVVGFFPSDEAPELVTFHELADAFRGDLKFAHMIGSDAMEIARQEFGVTSDALGFVVIRDSRLPVRKGEKKYAVFDDDMFDYAAAKTFVENNFRSLVNFGTKKNWMMRFAPIRPLVVVMTDIEWESTRLIQHEIDQLAQVAEKFPDINFAIADPEEMGELVPQLGLSDHDEDAVACFIEDERSRFPLPGAFTADKMIEHLQRHENGELKPYYRSQKEPSRHQGPVKTLVASSFERLAGDVSKDVVILFVTQVSSDCQKFEAVLKKVHKQLVSDSTLFFRFDVELNDLPVNFNAPSTPSLAMWPSGKERSSQPEVYKGRRRIDSILEFIRKNSGLSQSSTAEDPAPASKAESEQQSDHEEL